MAGRYILLFAFQQNRKRLEGKLSLNQLKVESFLSTILSRSFYLEIKIFKK